MKGNARPRLTTRAAREARGAEVRAAREARFSVGMTFGRLTALSETRVLVDEAHPRGRRAAVCRCSCGREVTVLVASLISETSPSRSCGCLSREVAGRQLSNWMRTTATHPSTTHGVARHELYRTWADMIDRCENPRAINFGLYGGRGITVCAEWHHPARFIADIEREIGPRPAGFTTGPSGRRAPAYTLDRVDNDKGYQPGNVRWTTPQQQQANRRPPRPRSHGPVARQVVCGICGARFTAYGIRAKFCSDPCRLANRRNTRQVLEYARHAG